MTATCLRTVVVGMEGQVPCKIFILRQILFLCQFNCLKIIRLAQR